MQQFQLNKKHHHERKQEITGDSVITYGQKYGRIISVQNLCRYLIHRTHKRDVEDAVPYKKRLWINTGVTSEHSSPLRKKYFAVTKRNQNGQDRHSTETNDFLLVIPCYIPTKCGQTGGDTPPLQKRQNINGTVKTVPYIHTPNS